MRLYNKVRKPKHRVRLFYILQYPPLVDTNHTTTITAKNQERNNYGVKVV